MDTQSERWELRRGLLFAPRTVLKGLIFCTSTIPITKPLYLHRYRVSENNRIRMNNNLRSPGENSLYIYVYMYIRWSAPN